MAKFVQKQVGRSRRDDSTESPGDITRPSGQSYDPETSYDADKTDDTLGSIDKALAAHEELAGQGQKGEGGALSPSAVKDAESSPSDGLYRGGSDELSKTKKKFWSRRKQAAAGLGAGGVVTVMTAFFMFTPQLKIPSIIGGLHNDIGSSRVTRRIIEKRFERIVANYLINKKLGTLDRVARPGSMLDKLYKTFDRVDLEGIIRRQNGIEFVRRGDHVHIKHGGKEYGPVDSYKDYKNLQRQSRGFAKDSRRIYTRTIPISRFGFSTVLRRYMYQFIPRFGTDAYDSKKSKEENLKALEKKRIETTLDRPIGLLDEGIKCVSEAKCDGFDRDIQPVDTASPDLTPDLSRVSTNTDDDKTVTAVNDNAQQAYQEAKVEGPKNGSFTERLMEKVVSLLIGKVGAKVLIAAIPAVGQIDLLARIQHGLGEAISKQILLKAPIMMREYMYATIGASWLGYKDQTEAGKMPNVYMRVLSAQLTGHDKAATHKALYGGTPQSGVQVNPKVGSNVHDPNAAILDNMYGCPWSPICWIRFPLEVWYVTITQAFDAIGDLGSTILVGALKLSGFYTFAQQKMIEILGPNWEQELVFFAAQLILRMFGMDIDPLAKGPAAFNNIYTGIDVINNRFLQTNLGAREVTAQENVLGLQRANDHYREDVASLPLKDRLFSLELSTSLTNRVVAAAPGSFDPASIAASISDAIRSLPAAFGSLISGHAWAAMTPQQSADINGVAQFGGSEAEEDADIPPEIQDQTDPVCPANEEGVFNNCQSYKEVVTIGMCVYTNCPQLER